MRTRQNYVYDPKMSTFTVLKWLGNHTIMMVVKDNIQNVRQCFIDGTKAFPLPRVQQRYLEAPIPAL